MAKLEQLEKAVADAVDVANAACLAYDDATCVALIARLELSDYLKEQDK